MFQGRADRSNLIAEQVHDLETKFRMKPETVHHGLAIDKGKFGILSNLGSQTVRRISHRRGQSDDGTRSENTSGVVRIADLQRQADTSATNKERTTNCIATVKQHRSFRATDDVGNSLELRLQLRRPDEVVR